MSRIGRMPIAIPAGVTVDIAENNHVTVKGPKGTLEKTLPTEMEIKVEGEEVVVTRPNDLKKMKSLHGLTRSLIQNMVTGVTEGYQNAVDELKNLFKDNYPGLEILESYDIALISNAFVFHVERGIIKDVDEDEGKEEKASLSIVRYILDINSMENYFLDENIEIESFDEGDVILTTKLH